MVVRLGWSLDTKPSNAWSKILFATLGWTPKPAKKKKNPALHTILECRGSWTESRSCFHISAVWPHNTTTTSLCWGVWRTRVKIFHPCTLVRACPPYNGIKVCSVWLGWKQVSFPYFSCFGNRLVSMLGSREPALRCLEDKGQNISPLSSGQSLAP